MFLSDISVKRPVFATVLSLLLVTFSIIAYQRLPLREYPDIDPPVVSIDTSYVGASAQTVETRITEVIEDRISGVEGIRFITSTSSDGRSRINIEFDVEQDIDAAANDIRDRVSGVIDNLPEEADAPDIQKADSSDDVILWFNLVSDRMNTLELTDYAKRNLQDRFSVLPGVARVRIGGGLEYAMRVWLDRQKMAARQITVQDIQQKLREENIELPAGQIESEEVQFTARIERAYKNADDFKRLVIKKDGDDFIYLADVAKIEKAAIEKRTFFRGNERPMIGLGVIKQSKANTIAVADEAEKLAARLRETLPEGMEIINSYDTSVFIRGAISEVYKTLFLAAGLVVLVIYIFLGSLRSMLVPAVTVPISILSTFIALYFLGFSVNLLTLLALVLSIGLVVDDAIVVLENVYRRIENGESKLVAAYKGTRQVGFAVIATTLVTIAVFVPVTFLEGDLGRLFTEFSITLIAAVSFSTFVALTLCPMIASKILKKEKKNKVNLYVDNSLEKLRRNYKKVLHVAIKHPYKMLGLFFALGLAGYVLLKAVPSEYTPKEDRGAFFLLVNGPEGASYNYTEEYMTEIEKRLMPYVDSGEVSRLLIRAPRSFGTLSSFNDGLAIVVLEDWSTRRSAFVIMKEIAGKLSDLPGVRAFPIMRQSFGGGTSKPVQFVIGGGEYEELAKWRDVLIEKIQEEKLPLVGVDSDYKETKPQLKVIIDKARAAALGVNVQTVGETLQTMLGSRSVTTYLDNGEEYDVILEGVRSNQNTPTDMQNLYVRSDTGQMVPLSNLVQIEEYADAKSLNRYNRIRAITIEANLQEGYSLGEALDDLVRLTKEHLPGEISIDYKGQSLDYATGSSSLVLIFVLGFIVVFLVLAAQFESFVHPFVIILTVPFAVVGALFGLYVTGNSLNVYTQVGLIMLVGLASKNGILIVEFANQLRDEGMAFIEAIEKAAQIRLRPIIMTSITTIVGAVPLALSFGAGAETRAAIGVVVLFGVFFGTFFTLFIVPAAYALLAQKTGSVSDVENQLNKELEEQEERNKKPQT